MQFRPSASRTRGVFARCTTYRTKTTVSSCVVTPGPRAIAFAIFAKSIAACTASRANVPAGVEASGSDIALSIAGAMRGGDESLLGRIGWAMHDNPFFASGTVRSDGIVMERSARTAVAKIGAEGLMCGALPEDGFGFALKVHTGSADARAVATFAVLERWFPGLLPPRAGAPWTVLRNVVGRPIGERVAVWTDS